MDQTNPKSTPDSPVYQPTQTRKPRPTTVASQSGKRVNRLAITVTPDEDEPAKNLSSQLQKHRHPLSGAVISFFVHSVLLLTLALLVFANNRKKSIGLVANIFVETQIETQPVIESDIKVEVETAVEKNQSDIEKLAEDHSLDTQPDLPVIAETEDEEPESEPANNTANFAPVKPEQNEASGGGLEGRQSGARSGLAAQYGGTPQSELAVENGLRWLANHQFEDGSWRLHFHRGPCDGRCRNPGTKESTTAATGLTLMAFLGAGYTHKSGKHQEAVNAGIDYLISRMRESYWGGDLAEGSMYAQAISTIALGEAYTLTRDPKLKPVLELALKYIVTAQHSAGGWRYKPAEPGDITVTGWQMMALKSCQIAEIDVPAETVTNGKKFIASLGDESSGRFGYKSIEPDPTSTAVGLLVLMYHGWSREHRGLVAGSDYIAKLGPSKNNIYYNYYATLMLFHARHQSWDAWNQGMRDYLIQTQATTGHEAGSWFFQERYGIAGGRLYTTAMAVMILEVYYRYLPLFDSEPIAAGR